MGPVSIIIIKTSYITITGDLRTHQNLYIKSIEEIKITQTKTSKDYSKNTTNMEVLARSVS